MGPRPDVVIQDNEINVIHSMLYIRSCEYLGLRINSMDYTQNVIIIVGIHLSNQSITRS